MFTKLSFFVAAVLMTTNLSAAEQGFNLSLKYGLTSLDNDDGWKLENSTIGFDATYDLGVVVQPRIDINYVNIKDKQKWEGVSALWQGALSAQIQQDTSLFDLPIGLYGFAGVGYEYVKDGTDVFDSLPFMQAGVGAKFAINNNINFLTEFRALQVIDSNNDSKDEDNEYTLFVGLNFPFTVQEKQPVKKIEREVPKPVVKPAPVVAPVVPVVIDTDHDGVPDDMDDCPGTVVTEDIDISERGCEIKILKDDDGDMVANDVDQCPNTPEGATVDSSGCAVLMNLHINFKTNSTQIAPESMEKIKLFAKYLKEQPQGTIVTIIGHTDNVGNENWNKKLSYKRALSVRDAILKEGIDWHMVKASGRGSSEPIASNTTAEGRAQNRRIEAVITHVEEK